MLKIVFPEFARTDAILDLLGEPRLPRLELLLARGKREVAAQTDMASLLCGEFAIPRQHDWPIAPISLAAAGGQAGDDYWLRADPVHLRIERGRAILNEIPDPGPDEARLLCEALSAHFGADFSPQPLRPDAWVARIVEEQDISTTPLSQAAGQPIEPLLPAGRDAMRWRRLLNEIQMLLFSHPVNQAREARGELAINSVWLWGGGRLPEARPSARAVLCDHPDWRALAQHAGAKSVTLPEKWSADVPEDALVIFDAPQRHLRRGDFDNWLKALRDFEQHWLAPLRAAGRSFELVDPLQGMKLVWRSAYRWKFWRRPQKPAKQTFKLQQPDADSGIDAFGNRY